MEVIFAVILFLQITTAQKASTVPTLIASGFPVQKTHLKRVSNNQV